MVMVEGKSGWRPSAGRQVKTALALVLTFGAGQACGSRSMLTTDEQSSSDAGADNGGTGGGTGGYGKGSGATGGSMPDGGVSGTTTTGGTYGYGGTGKGGSVGKGGSGYGGGSYGGTYGKGGSVGKGGSYGKGGSAGYPVADGGAYPYGGVSGLGGSAGKGGYPGRGGSYGKGGTVGKGGSGGGAGWYEGGAADEGDGGTGATGIGGSPSVIYACDAVCNNAPRACDDIPSDYDECMDVCTPLSSEYPTCELETADYLNCLAANLSSSAQCMVGSDGSCNGAGCTADAQAACTRSAEDFANCYGGVSCGTASGVGTGTCSYETSCPTHDHYTQCSLYDSASNTWYCTCSIDGSYQFTGYFPGSGQSTCQVVANYCSLAR